MATVFAFVEDFLLAQQFARAVALLDAQYPEADLRRRLSAETATVFVPADTGLVQTARELGFGGDRADGALWFLVSRIAEQSGVPSISAMLQFVLSHIAPGCHPVTRHDSPARLQMLCGDGILLSATGVVVTAAGCKVSMLVSDRDCDNGMVHVISAPLLPAGLQPGGRRQHRAPPWMPQRQLSEPRGAGRQGRGAAVPDRVSPDAAPGGSPIGWSAQYVIGTMRQDQRPAMMPLPARKPQLHDAAHESPPGRATPDPLHAAAVQGLNMLRQALTNPEHDRFRFDFDGKG